MTQNSAPWDGITVGDAATAPYDANEWSLFQSKFLGYGASRPDYGIIRGNSAAPAGNVAFYGLDVKATSPASTNVTLKAGTAIVAGTLYENDGDLPLVVQPNVSGNPRIDRVILRKDYVAQTVRAVILQGTPAASPVPPALTQTPGVLWEISLADIPVPNGFSVIQQYDIIPLFPFTNIPDQRMLDQVKNVSGGELTTGDVVVWDFDPTNDQFQLQAKTTTTINDPLRAGVWIGRTPSNGYGRVLIKGLGVVKVATAGTGVRRLITGSTAKVAQPTTLFPLGRVNTFGILMEGIIAIGTVLRLAYIDADFADGYDYTRVVDQKGVNAAGGTFTNGAWRTRDLNQITDVATYNVHTLAANVITIARAGTYVIRASAPAFNVDGHQTRLIVSGVGSTLRGTTEHAPTGVQSRSFVEYRGYLPAGSTIELQHRCVTTRATDGLGKPANLDSEVYSVVEIWGQSPLIG